MKSKGVAYLLWFFLGVFGAHKFYLNKVGVGLLYLFTGALCAFGWLYDLFTLGNQVDLYNALHRPAPGVQLNQTFMMPGSQGPATGTD